MRSLAEQAATELEDASAQDIIRWATDTFGDRIAITSSMSDAVLVHLASAIRPGIDVLFLDTGYHFAETIGTRDAVAAVYPSIGCRTCTMRVAPGADPRSGRWAGTGKTECGLHA
jgi:phosphoadenosine phosphosulfate reductase